MSRQFIFFTIIVLLASSANAQLTKIKELELHDVSSASVDRLGNFYFVLPSGIIKKIDPDGKLLDETSKEVKTLTLLEPWNPLKVFTYSSKSQKYQYWDHHLNFLEEKTLDPSLSISPSLVCPAYDVNIAWILDVADYSLRKVNLTTAQIEIEALLPANWATDQADFVFMREYQNRLFLLDGKKGILMLNNLGKLITTIDVGGLSFFNFLGQELCYRVGGNILLLDLHTGETRKVAELPNPDTISFTIITDERLVVGTQKKVTLYSLQLASR
ncbi:MAG TPA: hypothetical protein DIS90_01055 [Cytophagales bacterium]|nr:hypothetical protein [Cytophagales bacterium]